MSFDNKLTSALKKLIISEGLESVFPVLERLVSEPEDENNLLVIADFLYDYDSPLSEIARLIANGDDISGLWHKLNDEIAGRIEDKLVSISGGSSAHFYHNMVVFYILGDPRFGNIADKYGPINMVDYVARSMEIRYDTGGLAVTIYFSPRGNSFYRSKYRGLPPQSRQFRSNDSHHALWLLSKLPSQYWLPIAETICYMLISSHVIMTGYESASKDRYHGFDYGTKAGGFGKGQNTSPASYRLRHALALLHQTIRDQAVTVGTHVIDRALNNIKRAFEAVDESERAQLCPWLWQLKHYIDHNWPRSIQHIMWSDDGPHANVSNEIRKHNAEIRKAINRCSQFVGKLLSRCVKNG